MFEKEAKEYARNKMGGKEFELITDDDVSKYEEIQKDWQKGAEFGFQKGIKAKINTTTISDCPIKDEWHKLDWKTDYPKLDRLVRVRTKYGEEYICETYAYMPSEDEIGYGKVLTQFEELNGDWVDDNEIEYWCYIEPFKESE